MDLSQFDALAAAQESGINVNINAPDGSDTDIVIRVAGPDSERVRTARHKIRDKQIRNAQRFAKEPDEAAEARDIELLSHAVISWQNVMFNGQELPCTAENAALVFRKLPFVREQIDLAAGNRANFLT